MSFTHFLNRSLTTLENDAPLAYRALVDALGTQSVNVTVDGEVLAIRVVRRRIATSPPVESPTTSAQTSRQALTRLLRGEQDLTAAILNDEVVLVGALDDLTTLYDTLLCYFRGAVRSPGFPALLDEFLAPTRHDRFFTASTP